MIKENDLGHWSRLALLDVLRPPKGWQATDVLLSTYSLDLAVLVSCLLALTDGDSTEGGGSKVGLANAINHFRPDGSNRLTVLVQEGRITPARTHSKVLALLDRFVKEIHCDQHNDSWHAKVALVRFASVSTSSKNIEVEWRLWIGSRNLTRDMSWDTGLVLFSAIENASGLSGVDDFAKALLHESGWDDRRQKRLMAEIKQTKWILPKDILVHDIKWLNGTSNWQPQLPAVLDELVVVTPFFDMKSLKHLACLGGEMVERTLLTTQMELDRSLAGTNQTLDKWNVLCIESSEQSITTFVSSDDNELSDSNLGPEPIISNDEYCAIGLHAKLIAARYGKKVWLFMGSANITQRAWSRNTEAVVFLEGNTQLWSGVQALLGIASYADLDNLSDSIKKTSQNWLEDFRNTLCNLKMRQTLREEFVDLVADSTLIQLLATNEIQQWQAMDVHFEVAPLCGVNADYASWLPDKSNVQLRRSVESLAGESEMLCFRLSARNCDGNDENVIEQLNWIQCVPLDPKPEFDRDRRILANYLSPQQFLSWISSMLEGYENEVESWATVRETSSKSVRQTNMVRELDFPSIEALLRTWQKDPRSLQQVSDMLNRYFDSRIIHQADEHDTVEVLERFRRQLTEMSRVLGVSDP